MYTVLINYCYVNYLFKLLLFLIFVLNKKDIMYNIKKSSFFLNLLFVILVASSCSSVKYVKMRDHNISKCFDTGRWLINVVDADLSDKENANLRSAFVSTLKNINYCSFVCVDSIPKKYSSKLKQNYIYSEDDLSIPELENSYDYILNIRVDFEGQSYEERSEHICTHTETHYRGNRSYSTSTSHVKDLTDKHLDINTLIEVVVYDISSKEICYKQSVATDYSFIPTHSTTCEQESLTASIVVGIFDAIISTPPNSDTKVEHLLIKSCKKIAREIKRCYKQKKVSIEK